LTTTGQQKIIYINVLHLKYCANSD